MVKQLKRKSNWFTRKQSENAASVMDFSSTTVKKYIFKGILAQNRTRTIVFIVIGVYLYHFQDLGPMLKSKNVFSFPDTKG